MVNLIPLKPTNNSLNLKKEKYIQKFIILGENWVKRDKQSSLHGKAPFFNGLCSTFSTL